MTLAAGELESWVMIPIASMVWDLQTISLAVGIALTVLTILGKVTGFFGWLLIRYRQWGEPSSGLIEIPKRTVILIPIARPNALWWHMGAIGDKPAMQIVGDLNVTNISRYGIYLMAAKLRKPRATGFVMEGAHDSNMYGNHMIVEGGVSDLRFHFFVQPPVCSEGQPFKTDVAIIDQFGNEHWLKGVAFPYR